MRIGEIFGWPPQQGAQPPSQKAPRTALSKLVEACRSALSERGEVSGTRLAADILKAYQSLDAPSRAQFFDFLSKELSPDPQRVGSVGDAYRDNPSPENLARLQQVVEPPRRELFRRLNMAPEGTRILVEMRSRLMQEPDENRRAAWAPIASDLANLFTAWFNRGFLVLSRIDWNSPANILEKLIQYEAVHEVQGWSDLRRRLAADRRCYAFFHPALPDEPIIFVAAALTRGISDKVQPLLNPESPLLRPESADTAVFYSITNCQAGLRGIPFGSFLIKQVVENLEREFPRLRRFATLSPVPGFRVWLTENAASLERELHRSDIASLVKKLDEPAWHQQPALSATLENTLTPLCAYYLLHAKSRKEPLDSVARFHLRNGARLERINWLADTSKTGLTRSAGLMVNYLYRMPELEKNHELYTREFKIAASHEIEGLARQLLRPARNARRSKTA